MPRLGQGDLSRVAPRCGPRRHRRAVGAAGAPCTATDGRGAEPLGRSVRCTPGPATSARRQATDGSPRPARTTADRFLRHSLGSTLAICSPPDTGDLAPNHGVGWVPGLFGSWWPRRTCRNPGPRVHHSEAVTGERRGRPRTCGVGSLVPQIAPAPDMPRRLKSSLGHVRTPRNDLACPAGTGSSSSARVGNAPGRCFRRKRPARIGRTPPLRPARIPCNRIRRARPWSARPPAPILSGLRTNDDLLE